jgi:16S rRNA (adenine1518-N6/adenine1519-N6)-dimethyltransferase
MKDRAGRTRFAKRSLGQNFLVDQNYVKRIVTALNIAPNETVIEIGPGRGALTRELLPLTERVIAIELDADMIALLLETFPGDNNLTLLQQDVLKVDFAGLTENARSRGKPVKLVANLPYYISTAILQRLIDQRLVFSEMVLMFQREVAERIMALPGNAERGYLTVLVQAYFHLERLFDVPPAAFKPVPKVWSSVIKLRPKPGGEVPDRFAVVVSTAFSQKRKTILNNLKSTYPNAKEALEATGIEVGRRAETITIEEWILLVRELTHN